MSFPSLFFFFFFFNDPATTEIYTLSLHDALPICRTTPRRAAGGDPPGAGRAATRRRGRRETVARHPHPDRAGVPRRRDHPSQRGDPGSTPGPEQTRRERGGRRPTHTAGRGRDDVDVGRTAHEQEDRPADHRPAASPLPSDFERE